VNVSRFSLLVTVFLLLLPAGRAWARQQPDSAGPRVRFRFDLPPLELPRNPAVSPGGRYGLRLPIALAVDGWRRRLEARLDRERAARRHESLARRFAVDRQGPAVVARPLVPPPGVEPAGPPQALEVLSRYADLNLELTARIEAQVDQLRNLNCTAFDISNPASGCSGALPTPTLGQQFALRAGGVIADRIHINVDFDGSRDFSADNTINLSYQGLEDEILRRVEVGNLEFRLPESRFITAGIPANSFGVQADAQLGPLELRSILAQQKGSSLRTRTFTVGEQSTREVVRTDRDLDYAAGRFFFVVNPRLLPGYPAIDILDLTAAALPPAQSPVDVRVYRLRAQTGTIASNPSISGIDAVAVRNDSPQRIGPFPWDLLVEGIDYYLDVSSGWFALTNRLGNDEYLAVSYITALGDTVGTFPSESGAGVDTLELVWEPRRGPEVPTYFYEMRNVYRVGGRDVTRTSIDLQLLINDSDEPLDGRGTYLTRLGIAQAGDPNRVDEFNRVFPRERDPGEGQPLRDLFLVFPHLQPFGDASRLLPGERNDSLYRTPTYLLSTEGPPPLVEFDWRYETGGSGERGQLNLGALQIRDGSERLFIGNRELVRGQDYTISYAQGVVTFTDPDGLFSGPTRVEVRFEENQLFDFAPKNVLGMAATYRVGPRGRIDAIGLFQRERSVFTRPRLGLEPQAMFIGGVTGAFNFRADWLTRALNSLPLLATDVPSILDLNAEVAVSRPNPNRAGQAYIEEFESKSARRIPLVASNYQLGSRPLSVRGLSPELQGTMGGFDPADAVPLVWQNVIQTADGPLKIGPQQIDTTIALIGASQLDETLLWLTLKPDTVGGAPAPGTGKPRWIRPARPSPRWRSITHQLDRSGLGVDLSRTEFLEFWLLEDFALTARQEGLTLVFDFGTVLEDAVAFGPDAFTPVGADTVFSGFQFLGVNELDSERDPLTNVFNASINDVGILGDLVPVIRNTVTGELVRDVALCEQGFTVGLPVFPLGALNARCSRRNGEVDSEDLNGDNRLDITLGPAREDVVRFVVPVGDDRFVARTGVTLPNVDGRAMTWRFYRIPFRRDTVQVGSPDLRRIRSVRMTAVAPDRGVDREVSIALARMKLVGAPWLKRAATHITGVSGSTGEPHGEVVVSVISTDNEDLGYTSPPGVGNQADRRGAGLEFATQEINEHSLRLIGRDLLVGERAEAFLRFPDAEDRNFLQYRFLRVWARGRGPGWMERDLDFFVKVGRDEHNFYLYRIRAFTDDWLPEVQVEIDRWLTLRSEIERDWLNGVPPGGAVACGAGDPTAYVRCDGPYLVQVRDPGVSPPNLARVSEVAVGMFRRQETVLIPAAELWVDDIRLSDVIDDVGIASAFEARLAAADFAEVRLSVVNRNDRFRQLDETPDYRGDGTTRVATTIRAEKLLPAAWGVSLPVTVQHQRDRVDPLFVEGSDVRVGALQRFREPRATSTAISMSFRRTKRGRTLAERVLLDPVAISASRRVGQRVTERSDGRTRDVRVRFDYNNRPTPRTVRGAPPFLAHLLGGLPRWIRDSEFGQALRSSRLRLNPQQVRFVSGWTNLRADRELFRVPVHQLADSAETRLTSAVRLWRNALGIELRPYTSFGLRVDYTSIRDLRDYGDSTSVGRLTALERKRVAGLDAGFERDRELRTTLTVSPVVNSWLQPRMAIATEYAMHRDPNGRTPVPAPPGAGVGFRVPEVVRNLHRRELGSTLDLARLSEALAGPEGWLTRVFRGVLPADVRFRRVRGSTFDRIPFTPGLGFQLGFGGTGSFRARRGVPATSALASREWIAAAGSQLPLGLGVRINYRDLNSDTWIRRGQTQSRVTQRSREWPAGTVTWVYTPRWGLRNFLSTVTAQTQYRRGRTSTLRAALISSSADRGVFTEIDRRVLAPRLTMTWVSGIVTTARLSRVQTDALTAGNLTRTEATGWGGTMSFSVHAPTWIARLPSDVRAVIAVQGRDDVSCLRARGSSVCEPITDSRRRQVDLQLDTAFPPNMRGGASFSYVLTDQRHTSTRFRQVVFTLFVDINFLASQIR